MNQFAIWQGRPNPLGATVTPEGVNFALFSENASGVDLCLFDSADAPAETMRIRMVERTNHVWHCLMPDLKAGQHYGYRVYGPHDPRNGHRFNHSKLLLDPYAKAVSGLINWSGEMFGYAQNGSPDADLTLDERDNAWCMPKAIVVDDSFDWGGDRLPDIPQPEQIIYEVHVRAFQGSARHVPEELRGTYAGLASDYAIDYFQKLGITTLELLPVHHFVNDQFLEDKGLANYWGYNSICYFAPHSAYARGSESGAPGA